MLLGEEVWYPSPLMGRYALGAVGSVPLEVTVSDLLPYCNCLHGICSEKIPVLISQPVVLQQACKRKCLEGLLTHRFLGTTQTPCLVSVWMTEFCNVNRSRYCIAAAGLLTTY